MMLATQSILESDSFNSQRAVELSGLGDQPAFNKNFKRQYGITPKEMFEKKDYSFFKAKASWDKLGNEEVVNIPTNDGESSVSAGQRIFGVDYLKYTELKRIIELQELYSFDELQSETAYYIYRTHNVELDDSFRFVNEFQYNDSDDLIDENELKEELAYLRNISLLPKMKRLNILAEKNSIK